MNASKRKFNTLLNSFGSKSTTALSSKSEENNSSLVELALEGDATPNTKRRRTIRPISALSQTSSHSSPIISSKLVSRAYNKSHSLASTEPYPTDTPRYAPWDRVAFLKRLSSFKSVIDWTPKPAKVNEVEWSKQGWVCQGHERVRCELCNVEILVKLNVKEIEGEWKMVLNAADIEQALVDRYAGMIITSHSESCLWRQRGCDDAIFKLPLNHAPTTLQALHVRYNALCNMKDKLPYMHNMHTPGGFNLDLVISYLPKTFFDPVTVDKEISDSLVPVEINLVAFFMALFGWTAQPEPRLRNGASVCEACFRTLGLWLFKSKEINETGEVVQVASMNYLDPVEEHREYCPWRNGKTQSGDGPGTNSAQTPELLAAWQVVIRVLKNNHQLQQIGRSEITKPQTFLAEETRQPGTELANDPNEEGARSIREEKDKERWARLRRIRSLFDLKSSQKSPRNSALIDKKSREQR